MVNLTDKQYKILLDLYHELHAVFRTIPNEYKIAFLKKLYSETKV